MLSLVAALIVAQVPELTRDAYGVPIIKAASFGQACFAEGYAVAQDRLWQMELSRRAARGRLAEALGASMAASDREVLSVGYTTNELRTQYAKLSLNLQTAYREYARGVNAWIDEAKAKGSLPPGYAQTGTPAEAWSELDSMAITIRLLQQFGRGGAGEIRNMALLGYLKARPQTKARYLDVIDDFAWFNDPRSIPTLSAQDDQSTDRPRFYIPNRKATEAHLASLPNVGIFELLQGVRVASRTESTRAAEAVSAPFKTGSYCVVAAPSRSKTGMPVLLSGPQMGFRTPSIVHEVAISSPTVNVTGADVPGIPGVIVGHTQNVAWGLTSGVADTDDVIWYPSPEAGSYTVDGATRPMEVIDQPLKVKGGDTQIVRQSRTVDGPVVLDSRSGKAIFVKKTSYQDLEYESIEALAGVWTARNVPEALKSLERATMSFNFFAADRLGHIGYRYAGRVPIRAEGVDPRFPTPGGRQFAWRGFVPASAMPHALNPKSGLLVNWNNKPAAWWPNADTPVWGSVFRNEILLDALKPKVNVQDLELAAWTIARTDENWPGLRPFWERAVALEEKAKADSYRRSSEAFMPYAARLEAVRGFDGRLLDGSRQATAYLRFVDALREELFLSTTGNFVSPEYFRLVLQPTVMVNALRRKTRIDYLGKRTADQVLLAALERAASGPIEPYHPGSIPVPGGKAIPYINRGTYIQVVELLAAGIIGRNVVTPGVAESGPHAMDQVDLARAWNYKPMNRPWER